jgi:hypothetical protein
MEAENLLLGLSGTREPLAEGGSPLPIDEMRAWGDVTFKGGEYRVHSARAIYRRSSRKLYFESAGKQKVQLFLAGQPLHSWNEVELEWVPGLGYRTTERPAGGQWSSKKIEETLEHFDRANRREAPEDEP